MRKILTVAILCAAWSSTAVAFAGDGKAAAQTKAEHAKLLAQIAELKAALAKYRDVVAQRRVLAEDAKGKALVQLKRAEAEATKVRAVAQLKRAEAEATKVRAAAQLKRAEAERRRRLLGSDKRAFLEKRRVLILRTTKDGKPGSPKGRAGGERLEHLRAAMMHLQAAGQKELAQAVAQRFERLQAELQKTQRAPVKGGGKNRQGRGRIDGNLRELSQAIMQLRKQVQGLQKSVEQLQKRRK